MPGRNKLGDDDEVTRVLWVSRHSIKQKQREELQQLFGRVEIVKRNTTISNAEQIKRMMNDLECDEVVPIIPAPIQQRLVNDLGVQCINAVMSKTSRNGSYKFRHNGFERVVRERETKPLTQ